MLCVSIPDLQQERKIHMRAFSLQWSEQEDALNSHMSLLYESEKPSEKVR